MSSLHEYFQEAHFHDDVIKWKHFPRYWTFARGIHWSPVNSPHKDQWRGALMLSLISAWINGWVNNREAGDLRPPLGHYDVSVMDFKKISRVTWQVWRNPRFEDIEHIRCVYRLTATQNYLESFTVILHSPTCLPVGICLLCKGDFSALWKRVEIPTGHVSPECTAPLVPCIPNLYLYQPNKKGWRQPTGGPVSYATDRPTAGIV